MSEENLKIVITGDASGLDKAGKQASAAIDKISQSAAEWDRRARELNIQTNYTNRGFAKLGSTVQEVIPKIKATSTGFSGVGGSAIRAQYALSGIERAFRGNGMQGYVFGLQQTAREFGNMVAASGSVKGAFAGLGSVLTGPAGIIFGISFLAEIISKFVGKTKEVPEAVKQAKQQIDQLRKSILDGADAYAKAQSNTVKQEAALKLLYNAATDTTRSMKERLKAASDLQDLFPKTFSNLTQEQIATGKAATAYKNLADNILKAAQAAANFQIIMGNDQTIFKAQNDLAKTQPEYEKLSENVKKAQRALDDYNKAVTSGGVLTAIGAQATGGTLANKLAKDLEKAQNALKAVTDRQAEYKKVISDTTKQNDDLAKKTQILDLSLKDLGDGADGAGDKLKSVTKIMSELRDVMTGISNMGKNLGLSPEQIGGAQIKALQETMEIIAKRSGPAVVEIIKAIREQIAKIKTEDFLPELTGGRTNVNAPGITSPNVPTQAIGQPNLQVDTKKLGNINRQEISPFLESLKNLKIISDSTFSDMNDKISKNIGAANVLAGAFENIFSAAANGQNPFDALIQSVEQLIIKLAAAAAAVALLNFIPGGSAVLGVLDLASKASSFATGGYIPGPQLAVVGDAPGGEWVLNQKQISAILNGSGQRNSNMPSQITLRAAGADLVAVIDTNNRKQNRRG